MIITPRILVRITLIVVIGVLLQVTFFSQVELFHISPDILPALVVILGLLGGSLTGAVAGFSVGFLLDCLIFAPLGPSSLVLISVGYGSGVYRERFDLGNRWVAPLLCMAMTLAAELLFAVLQLMLGVDTPVSGLLAWDLIIKSIFAFFLGFPMYVGIRRILRPALVDEQPKPRRRRRRPRPQTLEI